MQQLFRFWRLGSSPAPSQARSRRWLVILPFFFAYLLVLLVTGWLQEDSYISLRTVDNFVNGHGLTWNTSERVQVFTHPLWVLLLSLFYFFTNDPFYTTIFLTITLSVIAVGILIFGIARTPQSAVPAIGILIFSRSFTDFSTAGLENPLTHVLLAAFLYIYLKSERLTLRTLFWLALIAGLSVFNRMDTLLLYAPTLAYIVWQLRTRKATIPIIALGFVPFILWELFAIFYYGSPFPNTAYAKLNTNLDSILFIRSGIQFFQIMFRQEPILLAAIAIGLIAPVLTKKWRHIPLTLGGIFYLLYIIRVGGDWMNGRFLTAPLLLAVTLLTVAIHSYHSRALWKIALPGLVAAGLSSSYFVTAVISERDYPAPSFWYECNNLFHTLREGRSRPSCGTEEVGDQLREEGPTVYTAQAIGLIGFYAGPDVQIVDMYALSEPLLARLPTSPTIVGIGNIGHFSRRIPAGYLDTLRSGENVIRDAGIAAYYDKLQLITRGNLFDRDRLIAIWKLNTGQYEHLLGDIDNLSSPSQSQLDLIDWETSGRVEPGQSIDVTFNWRLQERQPYDLYLGINLVDGQRNSIASQQKDSPLFASQPANVSVEDTYTLELPDDLHPGMYTLSVESRDPYLLGSRPRSFLSLPFKVSPPATSLPADMQPADALLGNAIRLQGYRATQNGKTISLNDVSPGELTLTLYWQVESKPDDNYQIFVHAQDDSQQIIPKDGPPFGGFYPTSIWDAGETLATEHVLMLPPDNGPLEFYTGMYSLPSVERLPVVQDGARSVDNRIELVPQ